LGGIFNGSCTSMVYASKLRNILGSKLRPCHVPLPYSTGYVILLRPVHVRIYPSSHYSVDSIMVTVLCKVKKSKAIPVTGRGGL
jgi:hypothetical protein